MKRTIIIALILALIFILIYDKPDVVGYDTRIVLDGDTLWDIAETSNGSDRMDTRKIVHEIRTASGLKSAEIKQGDVILVPIYEED